MQTVISGQANTVTHDLVAKATGAAITTGTVTFHLIALTGANAGKWFRASDSTWQSAEASAGAGTYVGSSLWKCTVAAAAWIADVVYSLYARESVALDIPYTEQIVTDWTGGTPVNITVEASATG